MKKISLILFFLFGVVVFSNTMKKDIDYKINDVSSINSVSFEFVNGKAEVKGEKVNFISIKGEVKVNGEENSLCDDVLKKVKIKVKKSGDELEISLNYDDLKKYLNNGNGFLGFFCSLSKHVQISVDLKIIVPKRMNVDFSCVNFDLGVEGVKSVNLSNVNGNINVINANKVKCESVNGNITLKDIIYKANCEVVNGNLKIDTNSPKMSSISFETVNGNSEIRLPFKVIGSVDTESLTSKTEFRTKTKTIVKKNFEWQGEGNCDIDVETVNGKIFIEGF